MHVISNRAAEPLLGWGIIPIENASCRTCTVVDCAEGAEEEEQSVKEKWSERSDENGRIFRERKEQLERVSGSDEIYPLTKLVESSRSE